MAFGPNFPIADDPVGVPHVDQAISGLNACALRMLFSLRSSDRPGLWLSAHSSSAHTGHTMDLTQVMAKGTYGFRRLMGQSINQVDYAHSSHQARACRETR